MQPKLNRFIAFMAILVAGNLTASSQTPGSKAKIYDTTLRSKPIIDTIDTLIENRLVALAMTSPVYDASMHRIKINELELKKAKNSWMNLLTISTNYNDQSFAPTQTVVYPKYFFGLTIPLGVIFSQGNQVKTARAAVALSKDQQEELARDIKADVLAKYRQYKLYNALIEVQSELINDVLAHAMQAEDDFKKGKIGVEAYITSLKSKNEELVKNMNLKYQQDVVKLEIEKIIGVPLESVLQPVPEAAPVTQPGKK
ncbi:MAG TPA: TolC family protein [Flavisolibacter sp.]|nr:TolC family protein [Flavisolibacter sp.]